jgi:hypothetical protein
LIAEIERMGQANSNTHGHEGRAEECCCYAISARSIAEKEAWLKLAEAWLTFARIANDEAQQAFNQRIVESAIENRRTSYSVSSGEPFSIGSGLEAPGAIESIRLSNEKSQRSPLLARSFALHGAEQRRLKQYRDTLTGSDEL